VPTNPPQLITGPPVPVVAIICDNDETCVDEGSTCNDGTTEECCGEVFNSFECKCEDIDGQGTLQYQCMFTDACLVPQCDTPEPTDPIGPTPPTVTPNPTKQPVAPPVDVGFQCPAASLVGCTAVDPQNPTDECDVVGEPCVDGNPGEFCCLDECPRKYCTAKQAASSVRKSSLEEVGELKIYHNVGGP